MKNSLWVIIIVVVAIIAFLVGYSQQHGEMTGQPAAEHAGYGTTSGGYGGGYGATSGGYGGGYGAPSGGYGAPSGGYGN